MKVLDGTLRWPEELSPHTVDGRSYFGAVIAFNQVVGPLQPLAHQGDEVGSRGVTEPRQDLYGELRQKTGEEDLPVGLGQHRPVRRKILAVLGLCGHQNSRGLGQGDVGKCGQVLGIARDKQ